MLWAQWPSKPGKKDTEVLVFRQSHGNGRWDKEQTFQVSKRSAGCADSMMNRCWWVCRKGTWTPQADPCNSIAFAACIAGVIFL